MGSVQFFKMSFMLHTRKKVIQVWNDMSLSKWWRNEKLIILCTVRYIVNIENINKCWKQYWPLTGFEQVEWLAFRCHFLYLSSRPVRRLVPGHLRRALYPAAEGWWQPLVLSGAHRPSSQPPEGPACPHSCGWGSQPPHVCSFPHSPHSPPQQCHHPPIRLCMLLHFSPPERKHINRLLHPKMKISYSTLCSEGRILLCSLVYIHLPNL